MPNSTLGAHYAHRSRSDSDLPKGTSVLRLKRLTCKSHSTTATGHMLLNIGDNLWAHESLIHEVVLPFLGIPMWHRMTVLRLANGEVLLHSPTLLDAELCAAIDALGPVTAVIAPSWWHDLYLDETLSLYPRARLFVAPILLKSNLRVSAQPLGEIAPALWSEQVVQLHIDGIALHFDEFVFYHPASRALILADLLANDDAFVGGVLRQLVRLASGTGCCFPRIFRPAVVNRERFRASIERVLEWDFDRIVVGHGSIIETGGREVFRNVFQWLL